MNASLALAAMNGSESDEFGWYDLSWESGRRDHLLGETGSPIQTIERVAEVLHREHLRTVNGRPDNDSFTTSRSWEVRSVP